MADIYGLVLSGGIGRRMEYQNKGLVDIHGKPLISYVCERLKLQVKTIFISANADQEQYEKLGFKVISDSPKYKELGPLAGIESVLSLLPSSARLQVVTCDSPFIPYDLVAMLFDKAKIIGTNAVYPATDIRAHYSFVQSDIGALAAARKLLDHKKQRVRDLLEAINAEPVHFDHEEDFLNCNTTEALDEVKRRLTVV